LAAKRDGFNLGQPKVHGMHINLVCNLHFQSKKCNRRFLRARVHHL
jgi:hypothetical protein